MLPEVAVRNFKALRGLICIAGMIAVASPVLAAQPASYLRDFSRTRAIIETSANVCLMLELYLADSREQQAQGLMFIKQMDELEGMLFRYGRDAKIMMWMKNTYMSLDMLFIQSDGEIVHIAPQTRPMSTDRISSQQAIRFVLELNAGTAERWSIEPGDRLLAID